MLWYTEEDNGSFTTSAAVGTSYRVNESRSLPKQKIVVSGVSECVNNVCEGALSDRLSDNTDKSTVMISDLSDNYASIV